MGFQLPVVTPTSVGAFIRILSTTFYTARGLGGSQDGRCLVFGRLDLMATEAVRDGDVTLCASASLTNADFQLTSIGTSCLA
jgi:hypothetical protein